MRLPAFIALAAFSIPPVATHARDAAPAGNAAREVALDNLLSERESETALATVIADAREAGISEQAILEARFLYHVDRREDGAIAAMLPDFLNQNAQFKIEDSEIFSVKEDWLAVVEYVHAIHHLGKGDRAAFKAHITEAFWLSPRQAAAFAPHIERLRLEDAMSSVKIDFATRLIPLSSPDPVVLGDLMDGSKGMLLHFWSPSSRECVESLPDFIATAMALADKGLAVVSLLTDDSAATLTEARKLVGTPGVKPPGAWLLDSKEAPLARDLRVNGFPLFVLVSNEGRVLFNGDPSDDGFWEALVKIDPRMARPEIPAPDE